MSENYQIKKDGREILTSEIYSNVEKCLKNCLSIQGTCRFVGIARSTWYLWKRKAEVDKEPQYVDFFKMVEESLGYAELNLLIQIQKDKSWQSKHALLSRRFQDQWGAKNSIDIQNEIKERLKDSPKIDLSLLDEEEKNTFLILCEKAMRKKVENDFNGN